MDIEEQTIIVKPRKIVSNKEVLEEIKKLFQEELNTNPECISLYDLSQLIKKSCEQRCCMNERYENKLNNILYLNDAENIHGDIYFIDFNYLKKQLKIEYYVSGNFEKVIYSKKDNDLYITSTTDEYYAQKTLVVLGNQISKLYDEYLEHKEYYAKIENYSYPKSVNSNFHICIGIVGINISSNIEPNTRENIFSLSTRHQDDDGVYQYKCNSNNIINEIKGHESELFKRIFIKIEDCPEWTRAILTEQRKKQLDKQQQNKKELQIKEEKKQKRLELLRKIFPFLDPNRMTMDEKQIEIANRHIYLEDKLSKLSIMQSDNKLTERTLNILFTKLRYEDDDNLSLKDLEYLVDAYLMPFDEINKHIDRYDSSLPKLDAIKFVNELASTYNVDKDKIIRRIQEVRNINKVIKLEQNNKTKRLMIGD